MTDTEELNRKAEAYKVQLSESFNSTTFKILLGWKEEIESVILKIEKQISSWSLQISLKVILQCVGNTCRNTLYIHTYYLLTTCVLVGHMYTRSRNILNIIYM